MEVITGHQRVHHMTVTKTSHYWLRKNFNCTNDVRRLASLHLIYPSHTAILKQSENEEQENVENK